MTERTICESNGRAVGRRVQYEYEADEPPSIAVTMALAQYRGEDATQMSTHLYDYVDPEALDAIVDGSGRAIDRHGVSSSRSAKRRSS